MAFLKKKTFFEQNTTYTNAVFEKQLSSEQNNPYTHSVFENKKYVCRISSQTLRILTQFYIDISKKHKNRFFFFCIKQTYFAMRATKIEIQFYVTLNLSFFMFFMFSFFKLSWLKTTYLEKKDPFNIFFQRIHIYLKKND